MSVSPPSPGGSVGLRLGLELPPSVMRAVAEYARRAPEDGGTTTPPKQGPAAQRRATAVLLGAGVDILLARATDEQARVPGWTDLIRGLQVFPKDVREELVSARASQWPTELAYLARLSLGDDVFQKKLAEKLEPRRFCVEPGKQEGVDALVGVARSARILVTLNYTEHFVQTLRRAGATVRQYDRPQLGQVQSLLRAPDTPNEVRLVYLHGRFGQGVPVLDSWGYSVLDNEDPHYNHFLRALFTSYDLLTVGVSWSDVPLREAAAYVCRTQPYARRTHLALMFHREPASFEDARRGVGVERACAAAMSAVFGVTVVPVTGDTQRDVLRALNTPLDLPGPEPKSEEEIGALADFLDASGDYECIEQHRWLSQGDGPEANLEKLVTTLGSKLDQATALGSWSVVARIERHVRHHLWIYPLKGTASAARRDLWVKLATRLDELLLNEGQWESLDPRLRFDLLAGIHELHLGTGADLARRLALYRIGDTVLEKRFVKVCPRVWEKPADCDELFRATLETGWEAMAPKVLLDNLLDTVQPDKVKVNDLPWANLVRDADRAAQLARSAGCFRRQVKADLLAAFWDHDPERGAERLRARIDSVPADEQERLEPPLWRALAVGRILCTMRRLKVALPTPDSVKETWDAARPEELATEARRTLQDLLTYFDSSFGYWAARSPFKAPEVIAAIKAQLEATAGKTPV